MPVMSGWKKQKCTAEEGQTYCKDAWVRKL